MLAHSRRCDGIGVDRKTCRYGAVGRDRAGDIGICCNRIGSVEVSRAAAGVRNRSHVVAGISVEDEACRQIIINGRW